jgi:ATP synthase subunit G
MPKTAKLDIQSSNDGILVLTQAEKRASEVTEQARKRRAQLMKKAKDESLFEVDSYKKSCEEHMNRLSKDYNMGQDLIVNKFNKDTQEKSVELRKQYERNYEQILASILDKTMRPKAEFHENLKI